jgi:hypothetical protein
MFIFHGLFLHDSRLHDMNRFLKHIQVILCCSFRSRSKPIPIFSSLLLECDFFEGLWKIKNVSIIFNAFFNTKFSAQIKSDNRQVDKSRIKNGTRSTDWNLNARNDLSNFMRRVDKLKQALRVNKNAIKQRKKTWNNKVGDQKVTDIQRLLNLKR